MKEDPMTDRDYDRDYWYGRGYDTEPTWRGGYGYGRQGYYERHYGRGRYGAYFGEPGWPDYRHGREVDYEPGWRGYGYGWAGRYGGRGWTSPERWTMRETFAGRGPRGYRRSDERIRDDVCDRLTLAPGIDASDVDVRVENGEVTLEGTVGSRYEKREAEDVAERVPGVGDVHNRLRVTPSAAGRSGAAGATAHGRVRNGMLVVGSDGDTIGTVKEVRGHDFLVDRAAAPDLYVPFSALRDLTGDRITLGVPAREVGNQGWETALGEQARTAGTWAPTPPR
jgi:hypothetical protein